MKWTIMKFESLDDAIKCYGKNNLVAISFLKQIIFYTKHGVQPCFIWESERNKGKLTCWYLKSETEYINKLWKDSKEDGVQ